LVRLPGRQAVEIDAVQDRNGFRAGFAGAECVGFHLRVGLPGRHAVGANRRGTAGE
jgi:hypothetical protein